MNSVFLYSILQSLVWAENGYPNPTWKDLSTPTGWVASHKVETSVGTVEVSKKMVDNFPCFKGKTTANADPLLLQKIASDANSAMQWSSAGVIEAKELYKSAQYVDYYQYLDVPVFSDRYWFLRGYFESYGNVVLFRWEKLPPSAHTEYYEKIRARYPDAEETPINIGSWIFTRNPDTPNITVEYLICTHPGGSIPDMLQSIATEKTLPTNIEDILKEEKRLSAIPK